MSGFSDGYEYVVYCDDFDDNGTSFADPQQAYFYLQTLLARGCNARISVHTRYSM